MRLLTLPITIVRVPIELGFGAAKQAVKFAHGLVGGGEETVVEEPRPARPRRRSPARRSGNGRASTSGRAGTGRTATGRPAATGGRAGTGRRTGTGRTGSSRARSRATAAQPPPAPVADEAAETAPVTAPGPEPVAATPASTAAEPAHVSEEPELVAEAAETGAEDGAGAEVAVDEPWPGYDEMNAADIEDRLVTEGAETAAAVSLYEASRKGRASILAAASRTMTA
jgi:hypothetical protein